jgi:hypothetical protein
MPSQVGVGSGKWVIESCEGNVSLASLNQVDVIPASTLTATGLLLSLFASIIAMLDARH